MGSFLNDNLARSSVLGVNVAENNIVCLFSYLNNYLIRLFILKRKISIAYLVITLKFVSFLLRNQYSKYNQLHRLQDIVNF
jgi:hypothetical protein